MGQALSRSHSPEALREMDSLAATGEQMSAALLALALQEAALPARSFTAHQVAIATDVSLLARLSRRRYTSLAPNATSYPSRSSACPMAS